MENSGGGATFTEQDLAQAKRLVSVLIKSELKAPVSETVVNAQALIWLEKTLLPGMEANIMELKKVVQTKPAAAASDESAPASE